MTGFAGPADNQDFPETPHGAEPITFEFDAGSLSATRRRLAATVAPTGPSARTDDFLIAISEAMTNSVLHGGGSGIVRLWLQSGEITAEVEDRGRIVDPLAGRRPPTPTQRGGRGLWIINQICDAFDVRLLPDGQIVRFTVRT